MGLQILVKANAEKDIEAVLGSNTAAQCEIFPVSVGHFGLSVPTKVIDSIGEQTLEKILASLHHFDLWAGSWRKPKPKWGAW